MTKKFNIEINENEALISAPYNQNFVECMHSLHANWNRTEHKWSINPKFINEAREGMMRVFGRSDISTDDDLVTVILKTTEELTRVHSGFALFGKQLARAFGRDSGAECDSDVIYLEGGCSSGGSVKNWKTVILANSIIKLVDVPRAVIETDEHSGIYRGMSYEIVETKNRTQNLLDEKQRLLKRIEEIDAELKALDTDSTN